MRGCLRALLLVGTMAAALTGSASVVAASPPPTVFIADPICIVGLGVSFSGAADWQGASPGDIAVSWGDGSWQTSIQFPMAHIYSTAGTYTVSVVATDGWGSATTQEAVGVGPGVKTCLYNISPRPIAATGTLAAGQHLKLVVTVTDLAGNPLIEPVWLGFKRTGGGGSAAVGPVMLGRRTLVFMSAGVTSPPLDIVYSTAATLPVSGTDIVMVANSPAKATMRMFDNYSYS
jgi:PKD repeat protein